MKMQQPEYRVFWGRRLSRQPRRHIARVIIGKRGAESLFGTALCGVFVAAYPESGELGRIENDLRRCPRCWSKYVKLTEDPASETTYAADDIGAARTSIRGECTCTFVAVPGSIPCRYTREDDAQCPVHHDPAAPLYSEYLAAQENLSQAQERFEAACVALGAAAEARHGR